MGKFILIETKEKTPSLIYKDERIEIRLHSGYAPKKEAERFIDSRKEEIKSSKVIIAYGLGLGYHLIELSKIINPETKVFVLELNSEVKKYASEIFSISEYEKKGFYFLISNNLKRVITFLQEIFENYSYEDICLLIHQPSLKIIPSECQIIKEIFEEWEIKRESSKANSGLMVANFNENIGSLNSFISLKLFQNMFKDLPIIIVSAGPSLDKNKHILPELRDKTVIIAVGSVVKPLLEIGCIPHFIVISEPHPISVRQLDGVNLKIPLIFLPTVQPEILKKYNGPKIILLQKGFEMSEKLALEKAWPLLETGGSVATAALSVAIYFGGNPIIFVGQDLAHTGGKSHADGVTSRRYQPDINKRWIKGIKGEMVPTGKVLSMYLRWIENKIYQNPHIRFINCTEGGAHIEGTEVLPLARVKKEFTRIIQADNITSNFLEKEMEA